MSDATQPSRPGLRSQDLLVRPPVCCWCGDTATCVGRYECETEDRYCCDDHCGHGNEDGHCRKLYQSPNAIGEARRDETPPRQ